MPGALPLLLLFTPLTGVDTVEDARSVLVLDLDATDDASRGTARLVRDQVAADLARRPELTVMTTDDIERIAGMEAGRQAAGCEASTACLIELAGAIGAEIVVHGSVGALGETQIVNFSIFNGKTGRSVARINIQTPDATALPSRVEEELARHFGPVDAPAAEPGPPFPWRPVVGWSAIGIGALGATAGAVLALGENAIVDDPAVPRGDKETALANGRSFLILALAGGVFAGAGAGLLLIGGE